LLLAVSCSLSAGTNNQQAPRKFAEELFRLPRGGTLKFRKYGIFCIKVAYTLTLAARIK
jgi:hypothetical protein